MAGQSWQWHFMENLLCLPTSTGGVGGGSSTGIKNDEGKGQSRGSRTGHRLGMHKVWLHL